MVQLIAGSAWAAPPAEWFSPIGLGNPNPAFLSGTIRINGVPVPVNPANMIAAFVPAFTNPVGVLNDWSGQPAGQYALMEVDQSDGTGAQNGALPGDNVTFKFYSADLDQVLTAYTMQNVSDGLPYFLFPSNISFLVEKTVNLDFQYDASPVWTNVPPNGSTVTMYEGTTISDTLVATDANGDAIVYGATGAPAFCSVNSGTGAIACAPGFAVAPSSDNICFTATSLGLSGTPLSAPPSCITLVVLDNNRAPVMTSVSPIDNVTLYAGTTSTFDFTATDADNQALTWSLSGTAPAFCQLAPTTGNAVTLTCLPTLADQGGSGSFDINVTDGIATVSNTLNGAVVNRKPVIGFVPGLQISYAKATPTTIPVTITDADGNAFTSDATMAPAKAWFAYDAATRTITVTGPVPIADLGDYTVTVTAVDNGIPPLAADNQFIAIRIVNQITWDNAIQPTSTVPEGGTIVFNTKATDPFGKPIVYGNPSGLPSFCTLNPDPTSRLVTCSPGYSDNGVYNLSFTASAGGFDAQPNPMTTTLTVTNTNRPPVLTVDNATLQNLVLYAGVSITRVFTASDADNQSLTWSTVGLPSFCQFTPEGNIATLFCLPTLAEQGTGSGSFVVAVSDGTDNAALTVSGSVVNRAPVIGPIATQTISNLKDTPTTIPVIITDADSNPIASSNAVMTPARPWFAYDSGTRRITVTGPIDNADLGSYSVAVSAADAGVPPLSADNVVFTINIVQQLYWDNVISASYTMDEGTSLSFSVKATNPLGGAITYGGAVPPPFCTVDGATRLVTCNPSFTDNGVYNLGFTAAGDGYFAQPNPMSTVLTVANVNRAPVVSPSTASDISGFVGSTFSQAFIGSDLDNEALTWTVDGMPSFCTLTAATPVTPAIVLPPSGAVTRSVSCSPTNVNQQGAYPVTLGVSDGIDNTTRPFTITVDNRAPVISPIATQSVGIDNTLAIPVVVTDPDGNAVTFDEVSISPAFSTPSLFAFDPATRIITIGPGLTAADVRSDYLITVRATDNSTFRPLAAPTVTATLKVFMPRRFAPPAAAPGTPVMTFSGTVGLLGAPAAFSDEVAAYSVHKVPGSYPVRWETTLVGAGRIEDASGGLAPMSVLGDNPSTAAVKEGCIPGEEVLLVLAHNLPGGGFQEYFAFDNGAGGPLSIAWNVAGGTADPNFIAGNRYPIRTGTWNLVSYGVDSAWSAGATQPATALSGAAVNWAPSSGPLLADLAKSFPLASIAGKFDRILGNSGTGGTRMLVAGGASNLASLQPGLGYLVKASPSGQELAWMTVPGNPVSPSATITVPQGYALLGFWDEGNRYRVDGFNDNATLASLRTLVENAGAGTPSISAGAGIGPVWSSIAGRFDRTIVYDAGGAKIFIQALPTQFNTMRYIAPGYGYWIKVTDPAGAPVGIGLLN
jgi:hypothetical protein